CEDRVDAASRSERFGDRCGPPVAVRSHLPELHGNPGEHGDHSELPAGTLTLSLRRSFEYHFAGNHRQIGTDGAQAFGRTGEQMVVENGEVAELAVLDGSAVLFVEAETRGRARHHPQR